MKTLFNLKTLFILLLALNFISCDNDDNTGSRSAEKIDVFINGATTPEKYDAIINANEFPLDPTTGYVSMFKIQGQHPVGLLFELNCPFSTITPYNVTVPYSETLTGNISNRLSIGLLDFDDTASNNLTITYTTFGTNVGDDIDININGTYYEVGNPTPQTLNVDIHVHRDN